jgi:Zn-dependent protease with chaperone function
MLLLAVTLMAGCLVGCQTDPITGGRQFNMYSIDDDIRFGQDAMKEFLDFSRQKGWLPADPNMQEKCEEILSRVSRVSHLPDLPWRIYYTENPTPNAFCLPGGQIMIFAGIWEMVEGDEELAAVIAHEVTHATARHGTERLTTLMTTQMLLLAANIAAAASGEPGAMRAMNAMNEMVRVLVPAYSRTQEFEADHWGMIYMAKAGYDPHAANRIWEHAAQTDSIPFDIYADHPGHAERAASLSALLPEAMDYYSRALGGEDFAATAGPAWERKGEREENDYGKPVPGRVPQDIIRQFRFETGKVDTSNYYIDHETDRVTVVVANTTKKDIEEFTLNITFYDVNGHIIYSVPHRETKDLDKGGRVQLAFRMPPGTRDVKFRVAKIEWD